MQRLFKPVRATVRPGASRVRRVPTRRPANKVHRETPDMSGLILYGQG